MFIDISNAKLFSPAQQLLWSDLSLRLNPGEIKGILGDSGSGKSSFLKSLLGLLPNRFVCTADKWEVMGKSKDFWFQKGREWERGSTFFYMPQNPEFAFHPFQSVETQFLDFFRLRKKEFSQDSVFAIWEKLSLESPERIWKSLPRNLSGGQKQRICLSLGFLFSFPIFLLDEPTTGLDSVSESRFLKEIKQLSKEQNSGVILLSQDHRVLESMASEITIIKKGESCERVILENGSWVPKSEYGKKLKKAYQFFH